MKPLISLTRFLETGRKLKLESGETYDDLAGDDQDKTECLQDESLDRVELNKEDD